jgi:hypothetical protein
MLSYIKLGQLLILVNLLFVLGFVVSCSTNNPVTTYSNTTPPTITSNISTTKSIPTIDVNALTTYKVFEMKADDIHQQLLKHPLYSVEIPALFPIGDEDLGDVRTYGVANVDFNIGQNNLYEQWLRIRVEPHTWYENANEKFNTWLKKENVNSDNLTTKQVKISGVPANYLEVTYKEEDPFYPTHLVTLRVISFDYENFIWEIALYWNYFDSEPIQVQEFFDHIISSFKFLE